MSDDIEKILKDIEADKQAKLHEEELARQMLRVDDRTAEKLIGERKSRVSGFQLRLDLEAENTEAGGNVSAAPENTSDAQAEFPGEEQVHNTGSSERQESAPDTVTAEDGNTDAEVAVEEKKQEEKPKEDPKARKQKGCARSILYGVLIIAISISLAVLFVIGFLDMSGLFKSDTKVSVTLTEDQIKDSGEVARVLKEAGVIDQPLMFQVFCKLTGSDKRIRPQDEASLSPDMGYKGIINALATTKREIVRVTFPEGMTVDDIARKLEKNNVCSASEFFAAMENNKLDFAFLKEIPESDAYRGRLRKLEGYVFPDSYDFYIDSSGEAVLRKFLQAFEDRVDATLIAKMKAKNMTLNDTIILASIIQWEAAKPDDMYGISRVIRNRLDNPGLYPRLECDSTQKYIDSILPPVGGQRVENLDYDTYKRKGLPVGAICNPGLVAIQAAIDPSNDAKVIGRYFFATDMKTGNTYYSKTLAEHEKTCRYYDIGMYAD